MIYVLIIIGILIILYILKKKFYRTKPNNVQCASGGPGSGKSFNQVMDITGNLFRKQYRALKTRNLKRKIHNFLHKNDKVELMDKFPIIFSNCPIKFKFRYGILWIHSEEINSKKIDIKMVLLHQRLPEYCIFFIDDMRNFVSQFEFNNRYVIENLQEFISLNRQYYDSYVLINAQSSDMIVKAVRDCVGTLYNYQRTYHIGPLFMSKVRQMNISEDIKVIDDNFSEDTEKTILRICLKKRYDSRYLSERVKTVPWGEYRLYNGFKTNEFPQFPKDLVSKKDIGTERDTFKKSMTSNSDEDIGKYK